MAQDKNYKSIFVIIGLIFVSLIIVIVVISFARPKAVVAIEGEPLEIKVQPTGELQYIPGEMVFHFSRPFAGVEGIIIDSDSIVNFITIDPSIPAHGRWVTERIFELYFEKAPTPDTKYEVKLFRIPLVTGAEDIPPQKYVFTTPPFILVSASLKSVEKKRAVISLNFNFAPQMLEIREFLRVHDSKGKIVRILDVRAERLHPEIVLITVPVEKAPEQYDVVVRKGLKSKKDVVLKKDVMNTIPLGFTTGPITVRERRVEESEEGYMLVFQMTSTAEHRLEIKDKELAKYVRIKPEISFRATAANNYIYIFADFIPEKTYEVTLKSGIMSKRGSILHEDYTTELTIPQRRETFQFMYQGRYLGKTGDWKLPLQVAKICSVRINIIYLPTENVLFWHLKDRGNKGRIHELGEMVVKDHEIPLEKGTKEQIIWIDLKEFLPETATGVFLIEANGRTEDKRRLHDNMAVVISDISLVVKWYKKNISVWAYNSSTLEPENGVHIEVKSRKNFLTGVGTTDINGVCHITALKEDRDPYVVFARRGNEWTYAHTQSLMLSTRAYDVSGETPTVPYLAYIYPERDLYRPGEEVHFAVVLREKYSFSGLALPVRISVRDPKGRNYLSLSGETDENGLCEFSFPTSASSPTGKYMLEVITGDRTLYTAHVFVETFVPERMRVSVSLPDTFDIYKPFPVDIEAEYLFGAPASGEKYTVKVSADETQFRCSGYYNYTFGMHTFWGAKTPSWRSAELTGTLDANGKDAKKISVDTNIVYQEPVVFTGYVTVTEGGSGRVTSRTVKRTVYTRPFYIGLKSNVSRATPGVPVVVKGVLLKPDCSLHTNKVKLWYKIYRLAYSYSYRYYEDYYWNSRIQKIPVTEAQLITASDGKFSFSFTPQARRNDYLIEVVDEEQGTTSQLRLAGWGWWYRDREEVESPEVVPLRVEKKEYDVYEKVTVEALLPFEGRILWTVELDTIYYSYWTDATGEVATWSFRAPQGVSTVYVSALLVRSGGNYLVQRGFGIERVRIRPHAVRLAFDVNVPERVRPGEELVIKVKGSHKFKGTIAVVDEGILQITDFKTPDPYEKILRDMRLSISSAESFGWIVKKYLEKTGGGLEAREKEFPEARFARIVSYWSGIVESGVDGRLEYKIKIPEYNGRLRVMVVGANKTRFGAQEASVIVRSDVIISPTIPRFMYTSDNFTFPITLINTTDRQKKANLSLDLKGGTIKGSRKLTVNLKPEEKKIMWFNCVAADDPGSLDLTIDGIADKEKYHENFVIPLYPNVPYITESEYITISPGDRVNLKEYFQEWYPRAHIAQVMLSSIPALSRLNHVRYAIRYPYGCIEQTSTTTLVLLRLSSLLQIIAPDISKERYTDMVNHGIHRIISMQTVSGGFTFWPGGLRDEPWISAYAIFVLLEAESAGFVVPQGVLKAALNYLSAVPDKSGFAYYVLARGGVLQKEPELVDRLITLGRKEEYEAMSALWLAGAVFESGRTTEAQILLDIALKRDKPKKRRHRGDFYSPLQLTGMRLYNVLNINPESIEANELALDIATALAGRESYRYTTQELAWTMLSLGLYAERKGKLDFDATLKLDGKVVQAKKEIGLHSWSLKNVAKYHSVMLETKSDDELFLNIENTGFSKKKRAFTPFTKGISLRRHTLSYYGEVISSVQQGDLVIVRIRVKGDARYDNVAVEASIPAGLEIENPRLGRDDLPAWATEMDSLWHPEYVDIKDDRVIIFGSVSGRASYYFVLTRAVTPGEYFVPPTRGIVMYNPDYNAFTDVGHFKIRKR